MCGFWNIKHNSRIIKQTKTSLFIVEDDTISCSFDSQSFSKYAPLVFSTCIMVQQRKYGKKEKDKRFEREETKT